MNRLIQASQKALPILGKVCAEPTENNRLRELRTKIYNELREAIDEARKKKPQFRSSPITGAIHTEE